MTPVAIVTAASKGMGAAVARELHGRGYRLALLARSEAVEEIGRETDALTLQGSVTETADLERLVTLTLERYGRIDAVVPRALPATWFAQLGNVLSLAWGIAILAVSLLVRRRRAS